MIAEHKKVNRFFLLLVGPLLGLFIGLVINGVTIQLISINESLTEPEPLSNQLVSINEELQHSENLARSISTSMKKTVDLYTKTTSTMKSINQLSRKTAGRPEHIYNNRITTKLGTPYANIQSDKIRIEMFKVKPGTYEGYALKIKLKSADAMKMVLAKDKLGAAETTLQAVKRSGAVAGINAGGFADSKGQRYPLSTTVLDKKYVGGFEPTYKDLFFVGLNEQGKLIGGKFSQKAQLDSLRPVFGASFVPVLMQNGNKTTIPDKWKTSPLRAPRTVIGNYKDDQLIVFVVDGYDERGGSGATLEELQGRMVKWGVQNAYNLDGGGSSSLVVNNRVVNRPSDGNLRAVPTHFVFFK